MIAAPQQSRAGQRGFTLLELMVVIVLLAIMTALIIPEMRGTFEEALLRSSARKLSDVFTVANSHAITRHELHRVRLEMSSGKFLVEKVSDGAGQRYTPLRDVPGAEGTVDTRIKIQFVKPPQGDQEQEPSRKPENDVISFYPDGTADGQSILLSDRQGFRLMVKINPATARVRIIEEAPE
jgi:type II secretion system protein H